MKTTRTMTITTQQADAVNILRQRSAIGHHIPPVDGLQIDPAQLDAVWDEWEWVWSHGEKGLWSLLGWVLRPHSDDVLLGRLWRLIDPVQQRMVADVIDAMAPQGVLL